MKLLTRLPRRSILLVAMLALGAGACELVAAVDRDKIPSGNAGGGTTAAGARGVLGGYDDGVAFGWAVGPTTDSPVQVRIEVSGATELTETGTADVQRDDLVDKDIHPTGEAGFRIDIGPVEGGSTIRAFIVDPEVELTGSPLEIDGGTGGGGMGGAGGMGTGGAGGMGTGAGGAGTGGSGTGGGSGGAGGGGTGGSGGS